MTCTRPIGYLGCGRISRYLCSATPKKGLAPPPPSTFSTPSCVSFSLQDSLQCSLRLYAYQILMSSKWSPLGPAPFGRSSRITLAAGCTVPRGTVSLLKAPRCIASLNIFRSTRDNATDIGPHIAVQRTLLDHATHLSCTRYAILSLKNTISLREFVPC